MLFLISGSRQSGSEDGIGKMTTASKKKMYAKKFIPKIDAKKFMQKKLKINLNE